jgi:site-specific DNA-methyltransferase (adenine-specific)
MPNWTLHQGDCLDVLKTLPDNSVDSVVTDPPYGLSNHDAVDVADALRCWLDGKPYAPKGKGFMGKGWDAFVPGPEVWRECLRVLKPGGHLLVFAGTRTQDLMGIAVRLAGFDARDSIIAHGMLHWTYGSGFPKNLDVSKALDKMSGAERVVLMDSPYANRGASGMTETKGWNPGPLGQPDRPPITAPATDAAKQWDGWGSALKPSQEPILVFRKPLIGTVAANVLAHGTGSINIDGCRVGTDSTRRVGNAGTNGDGHGMGTHSNLNGSDSGRWPPNTLLCHTPDCRQAGTAKITGDSRTGGGTRPGGFGNVGTKNGDGAPCSPGYADPDGTETVTAWDCADGCPVKALDAQTEESTASRFYPQFTYGEDDNPFLYMAKASTSERNEGLSQDNKHPTVKPISLMRWLCRLVTPPGGTVLDPFNGSGTTGCAAVLEGFHYVGIEREPEYVEIARARITHHLQASQGGIKNPWEGAPAPKPEPVTTPTPETAAPITLDDLFGF